MSDEDEGEKYTFRTGDLNKEELKKMAEELDVSLAEIVRQQVSNIKQLHENDEVEASPLDVMNDHAENMVDDEIYREVHQGFDNYDGDFEDFVREEEYFNTKWMDEESLDYEMMRDAVESAQRGEFEEAYGTVEEMREEGFEQEGFLFNTIVSEYRCSD